MRATLLLVLLGGVLLVAYRAGMLEIPERWNPWAPLQIAAEPNVLTRYKLARLGEDRELCRAALAQARMRYTPLPDRETGPGCGYRNAMRIEATSARVGDAFALSCRSAVALAMWELHVLQPAARSRYGAPVSRIEHFGSYSCRNVYGREGARRSQHASADALDIAGVVLENGKRIRVLGDWRDQGADAQFLREIHAGACRFFDAVLGPDYNAAHSDHFHFDRGSYRICR